MIVVRQNRCAIASHAWYGITGVAPAWQLSSLATIDSSALNPFNPAPFYRLAIAITPGISMLCAGFETCFGWGPKHLWCRDTMRSQQRCREGIDNSKSMSRIHMLRHVENRGGCFMWLAVLQSADVGGTGPITRMFNVRPSNRVF